MIVVLDESDGALGLVRFERRRDILHSALLRLYENPTLIGSFCIPDEEVFGFFRESCAFEADGYHYAWSGGNVVVPYDQLLVFRYDDASGLQLVNTLPTAGDRYRPLDIAGTGEDIPSRAFSLLAEFPTPRPDMMVDWARLH